MLKLELASFYRHKYDSEWHLSILSIENDFEYDVSRSLFSIGQKDSTWFLDLLWIRVLPRSLDDE